MATSRTASFNFYQQGNYGTLPQNGQTNMDVTPELHLKMSKKIAQLTKVIYALNTKNDEHEQIVQNLKDVHEEEMQQLRAETKDKLAYYKNKIGNESDYRRRIDSLEQALEKQEQNKKEALGQFASLKEQYEERESGDRASYSQKIMALSKELLSVKKDFELRLQEFEQVQLKFEDDKQASLEELRKAHTKEVDMLLRTQRAQASDISSEKEQIEKQYADQIEQLRLDCQQLIADKKQMSDDYESKLAKAQAFYEKELSVLRDGLDKEKMNQLLERENELKRKFTEQENLLKNKLSDMVAQLSLSEEEATDYKKKLAEAEENFRNYSQDSDGLRKQIMEANLESSSANARLKQADRDMLALKKKSSQQAAELIKKSSLIGTLEAAKLSHEAAIADLRSEATKLRDKLSWMENEKRSLEKLGQSQSQQQAEQLRSLEQSLQDLSAKKEAMRAKYERELESFKTGNQEWEMQRKEEHQQQLAEMEKRHANEMAALTHNASQELQLAKQEWEERLAGEMDRLSREKESVLGDLESLRSELTGQLQASQEEISRLEGLLADREQGLGSAGSQIDGLKANNAKLQAQLLGAQGGLRAANIDNEQLKNQLEKLKKEHEAKMEEAGRQLKARLDQLSKETDAKWTETLRREYEKLHSELSVQHSEDKKAALKQLTETKELEMAAEKQGWQDRVQQLHQQLNSLKSQMADKTKAAAEKGERLRAELSREIERVKAEIEARGAEHLRQVAAMEERFSSERAQLGREGEERLLALRAELEGRGLEEARAQEEAHRALLGHQQERLEKERQAALEEQKGRHFETVEKLKMELSGRHTGEMDQLAKAHRSQMAAAKMELERAIELKQRQEGEYKIKLEEVQEDLGHRERHIEVLQADSAELRSQLEALGKEIEFKAREIFRVRSEGNEMLRRRELDLAKGHQAEMDETTASFIREKHQMLNEFNKAQELLKDKISTLQIMLEEAEDRYLKRESRPEDLKTITDLRAMLQDREMAMKQLVDDKRFFQMELLNRETNFNKVFTASPNVGVLNPLAKKKKGEKGGPHQYVSAPSLNNRLDPLPDSPIHDKQLNPHPPLRKRFVK